MTEEQLRMAKLVEECSEVITELSHIQHIGCKILKHGYVYGAGNRYPDKKASLLLAIHELKVELLDLERARLAVEDDLSTLDIVKS